MLKKTTLFIPIFVSFFLVSASYAASVQQTIEQLLVGRKYTGSGIGIVIRDLEKDSIVCAVNADTQLNPASVAKLTTAAAAFELLGSASTFQTKVFIGGKFDADSGIVRGDLYVQGGGDPGFSAERLWLFVQHLFHKGIRLVEGNLVMDDSFFDTVSTGPGFDEESGSRAYQPMISALSASYSTIAVHHRSGSQAGSPVHVDLFPRIQGVKVISTAKTVGGKAGSIDIVTLPGGNSTSVAVRGSMGIGDQPKYTYRKVWQTWQSFGGALQAAFAETGISVKGKIRHGVVPDSIRVSGAFYTFDSEPLSEFVNHMFKYSSNYASEMIFKTLATVGKQSPGSWDEGAKTVAAWWDEKNFISGKPLIKNGSGMGNANRISANQVTSLLTYVWRQKAWFPEYLSALSTAGIDGTLKSRFKKSPLKGIVRGKTGTLNSYAVSTLAGYVLLPDRTLAFSILCNKVGGGQYDNWVMQELILEKAVGALGVKLQKASETKARSLPAWLEQGANGRDAEPAQSEPQN